MDISKPTMEDIETYLRVCFTADVYWDPGSVDHDAFHDAMVDEPDDDDPDPTYMDAWDGSLDSPSDDCTGV